VAPFVRLLLHSGLFGSAVVIVLAALLSLHRRSGHGLGNAASEANSFDKPFLFLTFPWFSKVTTHFQHHLAVSEQGWCQHQKMKWELVAPNRSPIYMRLDRPTEPSSNMRTVVQRPSFQKPKSWLPESPNLEFVAFASSNNLYSPYYRDAGRSLGTHPAHPVANGQRWKSHVRNASHSE